MILKTVKSTISSSCTAQSTHRQLKTIASRATLVERAQRKTQLRLPTPKVVVDRACNAFKRTSVSIALPAKLGRPAPRSVDGASLAAVESALEDTPADYVRDVIGLIGSRYVFKSPLPVEYVLTLCSECLPSSHRLPMHRLLLARYRRKFLSLFLPASWLIQ